MIKFLNIAIKRCDWFLKFLNIAIKRCNWFLKFLNIIIKRYDRSSLHGDVRFIVGIIVSFVYVFYSVSNKTYTNSTRKQLMSNLK